jgi:hypothetical protein
VKVKLIVTGKYTSMQGFSCWSKHLMLYLGVWEKLKFESTVAAAEFGRALSWTKITASVIQCSPYCPDIMLYISEV